MPPAFEVLLLNTAVPQIQAAQAGDTYVVPRDIAFSAVANLANGTYLLPALAFSSDPDTGIFRQGANQLGFTAGGGTDQMVLTSTGLGIGTSSPASKLHVSGTGTYIATFNNSSDDVRIELQRGGTQYGQISASTTSLNLVGSQSNTAIKFLVNGGTVTAATIDSSGNLGLGVGTGSPAARFNVESGDILLRGGQLTIGPTAGGNGAGAIRSTLNGVLGSLIFQTEDSNAALVDRMTLDSSGNLGLGVTPSGNYSLQAPNNFTTGFKGFNLGGIRGGASGSGYPRIGYNIRATNTSDVYNYDAGDVASAIRFDSGIAFFTAPSGTAGNAISFTQAMTLDASGRLGIGETSPTSKVHVSGSDANGLGIRVDNTVNSSQYLAMTMAGGTGFGVTGWDNSGIIEAVADGVGSGTRALYLSAYNGPMLFATNGRIERARITSGGDFQTSSGNSVMVGGTAARATTAGTNRVDIFDGTAPVGTLANGVSFYSASGEANVMDAAGNATLLSPHDAETNEWIFRSKHTPTGKVLKIDVERLLKFVNDHFGLDAVHEFIED